MRAEIRAGELLAEMKEKGERKTVGGSGANQYEQSSNVATIPKLSDLGISNQDAVLARAFHRDDLSRAPHI